MEKENGYQFAILLRL